MHCIRKRDGDGVVLVSVIDATRTYGASPVSQDDDPAGDALFRIRELFRSYAGTDGGTSLPMRWVMVGDRAVEPDARPSCSVCLHPTFGCSTGVLESDTRRG